MAQAPQSAPAANPTQFAPAIRVLEDAIAAHAFPGCAFGVLANGATILHGVLGRFTYEDSSPSVTPETIFDVASITKVAATTAAAMLLYQRGQLRLDTLVADLLPGFVVGRSSGTFARQVRLHHLLAHSSGLPGYVELFRTHTTPIGLLRACLELPIEASPGTHAEYSDPGFILLGKALEVLIHEPLSQWVHREILTPLKMSSSGFCPRPALRPAIPPTEEDSTFRLRLIQGEVQDENASVLHGAAGHAGLFSNVADLLRFADAILNSAAGQPNALFTPATIATFAKRQPPLDTSSRALGWDTPSENSSSGTYFSPNSIGHLGYSGCSLWIDLEANIAIVLLTNRTWPDRKSQLIKSIRPAFHNAIREALQ